MSQKKSVTLTKSLNILEIFAKKATPLRVDEISNQIGLSESTIYRYISTLGEHGFVEYDSFSKNIVLG